MKKKRCELIFEFDKSQNFPLTISQLTKDPSKSVIWTCPKCGHRWSAAISNRLKETECPQCQGTIPVPGKPSLQDTFPAIAQEWDHTLNVKGPEEYLPYSNKRISWVCENGHHWEEKINNRTANGTTCPYCNGSRPIPGVNDLGTLYPLAKQTMGCGCEW